jgi:hypothetical protein
VTATWPTGQQVQGQVQVQQQRQQRQQHHGYTSRLCMLVVWHHVEQPCMWSYSLVQAHTWESCFTVAGAVTVWAGQQRPDYMACIPSSCSVLSHPHPLSSCSTPQPHCLFLYPSSSCVTLPLHQAGCGVGRPFFHVTSCDSEVGGGFSTDHGVSQQQQQHTQEGTAGSSSSSSSSSSSGTYSPGTHAACQPLPEAATAATAAWQAL